MVVLWNKEVVSHAEDHLRVGGFQTCICCDSRLWPLTYTLRSTPSEYPFSMIDDYVGACRGQIERIEGGGDRSRSVRFEGMVVGGEGERINTRPKSAFVLFEEEGTRSNPRSLWPPGGETR